jgi:hypothetical protein
VHPAAVAGEPIRTGIDLTLVDAAHDEATRRRISYTDLPEPDGDDGDDGGAGVPAVTR